MSFLETDKLLFFFINRDLQNGFFDVVMPFVTGRSYVIFFFLFLWLFHKEKKKALTVLFVAVTAFMLSDWAAFTIKNIFQRIRPCNALEGVNLLVGCGKSFSLPSNHAANAFAFMTPFLLMTKEKVKYLFLLTAVAVGFSRVYVGVHYPSDVFAGASLGVIMASGMVLFYKRSVIRYKHNPHTTVLWVFLFAISLFRIYYILNGPMELSFDEAHYWEWSRRLDWSYYSKGPLIAYLIYAGTSVFGDTVFGIRILAVIFSLMSSVFLFLLGKELYNEKTGLISAVIFQLIPLFSAYGVLFTIDSPFIFFWIVSLYLFMKSVRSGTILNSSGNILLWVLLGVSIGLGLLAKYSMVFFYGCALFYLLFSRERNRLLLTKGPYISFSVSLLLFSPVIFWNAGYNWITLRHTAGQAHVAEGLQFHLKDFIEFIGSQFGVITPLLLIIMVYAVLFFRNRDEGRFLFWFSVPVIVFFMLKSLQGKVQANWAMPGYVTGLIAFSAFSAEQIVSGKGWKKTLILTSVLLSLLITAVAHYPSVLHLPLKFDPYVKLYGWKSLGAEVSDVFEQMSLKGPVFIFSDKYQVSSELAFYVRGNPVTYCINIDRRMNQYDLWPGFYNLLHYNAIFVRTGDVSAPEDISKAFSKVEKKVFTVYTKTRDRIKDFSIFTCYDFKGMQERKPETY